MPLTGLILCTNPLQLKILKIKWNPNQDRNWTGFFDQWVYKPDHPLYHNIYGIYSVPGGNWSVKFTANQEAQAFLPYFQMPIELKISFTDGTDTIVRVFNSFNGQNFDFEFNKTPNLLRFDPNNNILLRSSTLAVGITDIAASVDGLELKASPNPLRDQTQISFNLEKPVFVCMELYNSAGVKLETMIDSYLPAGINKKELNSEGLKPGTYYVVLHMNNSNATLRIIKT